MEIPDATFVDDFNGYNRTTGQLGIDTVSMEITRFDNRYIGFEALLQKLFLSLEWTPVNYRKRTAITAV